MTYINRELRSVYFDEISIPSRNYIYLKSLFFTYCGHVRCVLKMSSKCCDGHRTHLKISEIAKGIKLKVYIVSIVSLNIEVF